MYKSIFLSLFIILFGSCQKEDEPFVSPCQDGLIKFDLFNDELNPKVRFKELGVFKEKYELIQSEHEMYEQLEIDYLKTKIDFKRKSLIVISVKLTTHAQVTAQNITADCTNNKLRVKADLRYGSEAREGVSYVLAVITKVPVGTILEFSPNYTR